MSSLFVGIDPGFTDTAIVVIDEDGKVIDEVHVSVTDKDIGGDCDICRIIEYESRIRGVLMPFASNPDCWMAVEKPLGANKGKGVAVQWAYTSIILAVAMHCDDMKRLAYHTPSKIKKFITGKGNSKKELMLKEIYKRWGFETDNHNTGDAYAIAQLVRSEA